VKQSNVKAQADSHRSVQSLSRPQVGLPPDALSRLESEDYRHPVLASQMRWLLSGEQTFLLNVRRQQNRLAISAASGY
jgi:hypothetical protein